MHLLQQTVKMKIFGILQSTMCDMNMSVFGLIVRECHECLQHLTIRRFKQRMWS